MGEGRGKIRGSLGRRILIFVCTLVLLSLFGSTLSLYRITSVNQSLDAINTVSVPLGRVLSQMQSDADLLEREVERRLGSAHWNDEHWRPRPLPKWILDLLQNELLRAEELINTDISWTDAQDKQNWSKWITDLSLKFSTIKEESQMLYNAFEKEDGSPSEQNYEKWIASVRQWVHTIHLGVGDFDKLLRQSFSDAQSVVSQLKTGLQTILIVIVLMSLLLLWLAERALRPLNQLTKMAHEITHRGLRKEDKSILPDLNISRKDEVSELALEFRRMATSLLEREKTVELQKARLQEQNTLLTKMGELKERLREAENFAAIGRLSAQVAHEVRNPLHSIGLEAEMAVELSSKLQNSQLKQALLSILASVDRLDKITENYLRLSRLSAGRKNVFDIGEALEGVLATYAPACETQGVKVDWMREAQGSFNVLGDKELLEQALGNLMKNSLQAIQTKGFIRWSLGNTETNRVWLRIEDSGPGVDPTIRERLFMPFATTKAQGTGLGLSFVKKVIEEHLGEISYIEIERGACFEVSLPIALSSIEEVGVNAESLTC